MELFLAVSSLVSQPSLADEAPPPPAPAAQDLAFLEPLSIGAAYLYDFPHRHGMTGEAEYVLWSSTRNRVVASGRLSFYEHPGSHFAVQLVPAIAYRFTTLFGLLLDADLGVGYMHAWLHGDVYERHDGAIRPSSHRSQPTSYSSLRLGIGWDLSRRFSLPLSVFYRFGSAIEYPYNNTNTLHLTGELGVRYDL